MVIDASGHRLRAFDRTASVPSFGASLL